LLVFDRHGVHSPTATAAKQACRAVTLSGGQLNYFNASAPNPKRRSDSVSEGFVSLVGAGPWDPELLTLAARDRLARADVVIVDYLVNPATLLHCRADVQVFQRVAGPRRGEALDQDQVNTLLVEHARAGRYVVRLKGGDPMMFGRGAEEAAYLRE